MMFRYFGLVVTFGISLCSAVYSANNGKIVISYEVPDQAPGSIRQKFFNGVVGKAVPGKIAPDRYHVTLMWLDGVVNQQHQKLLQERLNKIRDKSLPHAHFTPGAACQLLPSQAIVIQSANAAENQQFKKINGLLYSEVMKFNAKYKTSYQPTAYLTPKTYKPHMTIADTAHITAHGINPQQVIQDVNLELANYKNIPGAPLDLLQIKNKKPAPKHKKPAPKPKKHAPKHKKPAPKPKKHAPKHKKH